MISTVMGPKAISELHLLLYCTILDTSQQIIIELGNTFSLKDSHDCLTSKNIFRFFEQTYFVRLL